MGSGDRQQLKIAVIGTGVAGLTAAWLLSQRHDVTVYERDGRVGGHCCTVRVPCGGGTTIAVDTGFIVYNEETYPNLAALFAHLNVPTQLSDMSFAVSLDGGAVEYSGSTQGLFAQKRNLFRQRFWSMLSDIRRFYREAPNDLPMLDEFHTTIGDYLKTNRYGAAFRDDHLLPMAGAIWSAPPRAILGYPAASFIRFYLNHGLLRLSNRIKWRTVKGGSRAYVDRLTATFSDRIKLERAARAVWRNGSKVAVLCSSGQLEWFDHLVVASHADEALTILDDPSGAECALLSAFRYSRNRAVLHGDVTLMPRRKSTWSSWNFIEQAAPQAFAGKLRRDLLDESAAESWINAAPIFVWHRCNKAMVGFLSHSGYSHGGNGYEGMAFFWMCSRTATLRSPPTPGTDLQINGNKIRRKLPRGQSSGEGGGLRDTQRASRLASTMIRASGLLLPYGKARCKDYQTGALAKRDPEF
jgi:uncharacterized protein